MNELRKILRKNFKKPELNLNNCIMIAHRVVITEGGKERERCVIDDSLVLVAVAAAAAAGQVSHKN